MKKIKLTIFILISSFFILHSSFALAATPSQEAMDQLNAAAGSSGANIAGSGPMDPRMIAAIIIRASLAFIGIIFIVLIMYAGWLWMTAAGEEEKIGKAKKLILNGVIGLAIILAAYSITYFIFKVASGQGVGTGCDTYGGANANITNCGGNNPSNWHTTENP